ncbi:hypothetical protein PF002_g17398 [Phytophthora fragariae]|nr:hypothetical protein PF009_g17288 [Phytophthora fragariae]KAE8998580.1 hypothetical protein PF011_g14992 [Phytophthora fragariae]KAE9098405.1 hypothetical protein PF007_g16276 [Phytophthora fragariae]KAE9133286.1 hypothetical protein PF006_g15064 [Phytophthora fragariae]KAE9214440.1 hypothetical protein PF004_g15042 [Phytophthora fragariae]
MATLSLSQLKDALAAVGVSTATGDLRGEARRDELARRLHHARVASGDVKLNEEGGEGEEVRGLQNLSLAELRSALELRQISTQTSGLKGEARRHALIQRLMNAYSHKQERPAGYHITSSQRSEEDEEDAKSETSSSVYSTATEFIFYDTLKGNLKVDPELQLNATSLMPQLSFTGLKKAKAEPQIAGTSAKDTNELQRELFELRAQLHTARQERQQQVERALLEAGIATSLGEISTKLQALERERRRLQDNYFGHELVTCDVLSSSGSNQLPLELVQEDALLLIEKRQAVLKQLAERTKEAMAVAKSHTLESETSISKQTRQEEAALMEQIQQLELSLSSPFWVHNGWTNPRHSEDTGPASEMPVLVRCRSMPNGLQPELWETFGAHERRQLHSELRTAASFHVRRDRVVLNTVSNAGVSPSAPSQADKLGMKARFMEKTQRHRDEIERVYLNALELDENHADNLGNYALFLCTTCGEPEKARNYFERALAADPMNAKNLANYANFLLRECHDFNKGEVCYKKALDVAPKDVNILGGYSDLLTAKANGNGEILLRARRILKKALSLSPSHQMNQLRLALVLADLKENEPAERCFEHLLFTWRQQNNAGDDGDLTHAKIQTHRDKLSLTSIYEKYAGFLHRRGDWSRAKVLYGEALALDPQRPSLIRQFSCFLRDSKPFLTPRSQSSSTS